MFYKINARKTNHKCESVIQEMASAEWAKRNARQEAYESMSVGQQAYEDILWEQSSSGLRAILGSE